MLRTTIRVMGAAALCLAGKAMAAYVCSVTVTSITTVYSPTVATDNITTGSYTVSCTRLVSDPATLNYSLGADNGVHAAGAQDRVQQGATANRYNYEPYRLTPYVNANRWQDAAATRFNGSIAFGAGLSGSDTKAFDLRVPGSQAVRPAGTYTDTVAVTLRNLAGLATLASGAFNVTVITTNSCQIETAPGNLSFSYTSFQAGIVTASTTFGARCTTGLPYTMALDVTAGTLLGLNYMLSLSAAGGTGNGLEQTYTINGSIAAGQAGTCASASCAGSQTRTLTITY